MATPREYEFGERMAMSEGTAANESIGEILTSEIPGAITATRANSANDRRGTDWWVEVLGHEEGRTLSVDVKVREEDFAVKGKGYDDLALETWSVIEGGVPGWTRDTRKRTDYVLWVWKDTGRWCLLPFLLLCAVFTDHWEQWRTTYQTAKQFTPPRGRFREGWHSECTYVPRKVVWRAIYQRFGGEPRAKTETTTSALVRLPADLSWERVEQGELALGVEP